MKADRLILTGMQVLLEREIVHHKSLIIEEGRIKAIIADEMIKSHLPARCSHFSDDYILVPGFIDLHIHGTHGADVMDADKMALLIISKALAAEGVTGFLATTMTAENARIEKIIHLVAGLMKEDHSHGILGMHLEGPFLALSKKGAQEGQLQLPNLDLIKTWNALAPGVIKIITLAPELPAANELIKMLKNLNIIASIGHTNATYAETMSGIQSGATHATHLFNAMRGISQREPGAVGALLNAESVSAELIVDGVHLHPAIVELAFKMKTPDRLFLVTDAMRAKCLSDGQYELGGQMVKVSSGQARLPEGTLAGSTLRMIDAIRNMCTYTRCSLVSAIKMASFNPANSLKLTARKGSIEVGKDADLVLLSPQIEVLKTWRAGEIVFEH